MYYFRNGKMQNKGGNRRAAVVPVAAKPDTSLHIVKMEHSPASASAIFFNQQPSQ